MSAKKTGRKKKSEYRKYKKQLKNLLKVFECVNTTQMIVNNAIILSRIAKLKNDKLQCGGIISNSIKKEVVLLTKDIKNIMKETKAI
jgi:hypothetical protein